MKIIYCCYGGAHSSPIAAAIHLGYLSTTKCPTGEELWRLPYFDKTDGRDRGNVMFVGIDGDGHEVYICGRGREKLGIEQAIRSGIRLACGSQEDILFVDTLSAVNLWMRIGGYLSRQWKVTQVGRPIVIFGSQMAFFNLVEIVNQAKQSVQFMISTKS